MNNLKIYSSKYSKYLILICILFSNTSANSQVTCTAKFCYEAVLDSNGNICVTYHNFSTSNDSIIQYAWNFNCDGLHSSLFEPVFCFPLASCPPGTAVTELYIQTINNCVSTYSDTIFLGTTCLTGTPEINTEKKESFTLYPNPASAYVIYKTWLNEGETLSIVFYDVMGKPIISKQITGTTEEQFDLSKISSGIYFYKITLNQKQVQTGKLIISK